VNLSKDEIDELKSNAKQEHDAKLSEITGAVVDKVQGVLGHFSEKIKSGETFRDSTIDKVIDLCDVLPSLNVAGDTKIHNAHQELMDIFVGNNIDADTLRKDKDKANEIATKTDAVLDDLGGWLND
jgi:ABC-type transporter Mla subunit MlaD